MNSFPVQNGPGARLYSSGSRAYPENVLELRSPEASRPIPPRTPEGPQLVQAFISRHRPFFTLLVVLVGQLVMLSVQITRSRSVPLAKVWAMTVLSPFERSLGGMADSVSGAWQKAHSLSRAEQVNRDLTAELARDDAEIHTLSEQAAENVRLRSLLDFRARTSYTTVAAEVIGSSPADVSNTVLIDKGSDAGLRVDLPVLTPDGVVGKIVAAYPNTAQVLLITDPAAGAGALIQTSRVQGVLKGTGRGTCRLDYVMNEDAVRVGDLVVTSGLDQVFPKGLPVGRVVQVGDGSVYKRILLKPAAALDRLEDVLVVFSKPTEHEQSKAQH